MVQWYTVKVNCNTKLTIFIQEKWQHMGLTTYSSIFSIYTSCNYSDTKLVIMKVLSKTVHLALPKLAPGVTVVETLNILR